MARKLTAVPGGAVRRFTALPTASKIALGLFTVVAVLAVFAPWFASSPLATGTPVQAPGSGAGSAPTPSGAMCSPASSTVLARP